MTTDTLDIAWPHKLSEAHDPVMNSKLWNDFAFRDDDIVIATYAKSGTTLTQQIVAQLVFDASPDVYGQALSPWIDFRLTPEAPAQAQAQTHRRFLKTHLALPHLVYSPRAKYLFVARDTRDVAWSLHNHVTNFTQAAIEASKEAAAGFDPPPPPDVDVRRFYHAFLDGPAQVPAYWSYIQEWWDIRGLPNILLLHYADLIGDMPGQIRRIAAFLDVPLNDAKLPAMVNHCSLTHMRKVAADDPLLNRHFQRGAETFINKGTNGRWRDVLSQDEIDKCDRIAARELTLDCAAWLRHGGYSSPTPQRSRSLSQL